MFFFLSNIKILKFLIFCLSILVRVLEKGEVGFYVIINWIVIYYLSMYLSFFFNFVHNHWDFDI